MLMCEYEPIPRGQGVQGDQTIFTMRHWTLGFKCWEGALQYFTQNVRLFDDIQHVYQNVIFQCYLHSKCDFVF